MISKPQTTSSSNRAIMVGRLLIGDIVFGFAYNIEN